MCSLSNLVYSSLSLSLSLSHTHTLIDSVSMLSRSSLSRYPRIPVGCVLVEGRGVTDPD